MKYLNFITALLLLLVSNIALSSVPLAARMGANGKMDMFGCMLSNDYYIVNFAAYQATAQQKAEKKLIVPQCQDLAYLGNTQIAIDLLDRDVRRKPVWIKIFDAHQKLIAETAPQVPKQAVITTNVNFLHQGQYDVVVYVEDEDLKANPETSALHIPLMVASIAAGEPASGTGFLTVAGVVIAFALLLGVLMTRQFKPNVAQ
jgi:hypothetical protein